MQAVPVKKPSFKAPVFAAPSKKADVDSKADKQNNQKNSQNGMALGPAASGDHAPNVADSEKSSPMIVPEKKTEKNAPKPKFAIKTASSAPDTSSTKKVKSGTAEEKKKKSKKPKADVSKDSVSKDKSADAEKKKPKKRKKEKKDAETADDKNKNVEQPAPTISGDNAYSQSVEKAAPTAAGDNAPTVTEPETPSLTAENVKPATETDQKREAEMDPERKAETDQEKEAEMDKMKVEETDQKKAGTKKSSKKEEKEKMPVRSLTDSQYDELFDAALETAMNLDLDKWLPKITSPLKVREPVKKKYSKTVGRKSQPKHSPVVEEKQESDNGGDSEHESEDEGEAVELANIAPEPAEAAEDDTDEEVEVEQGLDQVEPEAQEQEQQEEEAESIGDVQEANETTPHHRNHVPIDCSSPPPKKTKPNTVNKSELKPKSLSFSDKREMSMIDKIQQLKKLKEELRKEKQGILKLKKAKEMPKKRDISKKEDVTSRKQKQKTKNKKKHMLDRELETDGTWVQCCNSTCMKWRHLTEVNDPSEIPERWTCNMNTCEKYNNCDKAEEQYDESEHIYTKFTEGSVVWAKMIGYPWWPAMVEQDPDSDTFFSVDHEESMIPTHYHVVFFDERVSRSWVKTINLKTYTGDEMDDGVVSVKMSKRDSKEIEVAKKNASRALSCDLKTRIELFGFATRFSGSWGKTTSEEPSVSKTKTQGKRKPQSDKPVQPKKRSCEPDPMEILDDSTMDDVIGNTDAILEDVDGLLDSLNDSDMDSDFVPEDLVVVEKKNMKKIRGGEPESKRRKKQVFDYKDSASEKEDYHDKDSELDAKPNACELDNPPAENMNIKFDNEIFTMEMDDDSSNEVKIETKKPEAEKVVKKTARQDEGKEDDKSSVKPNTKKSSCHKDKKSKDTKPKEKKKSSGKGKNSKEDTVLSDCKDSVNENTKKDHLQKEDKKPAEPQTVCEDKLKKSNLKQSDSSTSDDNKKDIYDSEGEWDLCEDIGEDSEACNTSVKSTRDNNIENSNSEDELDLCGDKNKDGNKCKTYVNSAANEKDNEGDSENDFDLCDKKNNEDVNEGKTSTSSTSNEKTEDGEDDFDLGEDKAETLDKAEQSTNSKANEKSDDSDSEDGFDLCEDNAEAVNDHKTSVNNTSNEKTENSDSEDDFDLCGDADMEVPEANNNREVQAAQQQESFNMDDESDDNFDLDEQSLYDSVVDSSQKSQERAITPVIEEPPVAIISEGNLYYMIEE